MGDCWDAMIVGMKVEVENLDTDGAHVSPLSSSSDAAPSPAAVESNGTFWVASVLRISGYYALLR